MNFRKVIILYLYLIAALLGAGGMVSAQTGGSGSERINLTEIPLGHFRSKLETLPVNIQTQVLSRVSALEIPELDFGSLRVHPRGGIYYICDMEAPASRIQAAQAGAPEALVFSNSVSIASPPVFHSRTGSVNVLFLDFNGAVVTNTYWNNDPEFGSVASWDCRPYSIDADETTFSVAEQQAIQTIWERVAEDYAPFDIDVTTEQPVAWTRYTGHVLIAPGTDKNGVACPHDGYGGIAYVDVFGEADYSYNSAGRSYSPAWVLNYERPGFAEYEAEAAAHEMGHNLALSHDGTKRTGYYGGHENGSIGWGPIMGTGYDRDVSQWSKGDYRLSNNSQDDLAILASQISYRPDDFGDDNASAATLAVGIIGEVFQAGVVEMNTDTDVFQFNAISGTVDITVSPYRDSVSTTWGGNLDVILELYDATGVLLAASDPTLETIASLTTAVSDGIYYLHIRSTGVGNPQAPSPTGYVQYGSLGQYTITGNIASSLDVDGDGLPNDWETTYFLNPTGAVATADSDGDGADNLTEYISGFDPSDSNSVFEITTFSAPVTGSVPFIVTWDSVASRIYTVDWSSNLVSMVFTNISGDLPYPASTYTDTVERTSQQQFYRVDVRLQE